MAAGCLHELSLPAINGQEIGVRLRDIQLLGCRLHSRIQSNFLWFSEFLDQRLPVADHVFLTFLDLKDDVCEPDKLCRGTREEGRGLLVAREPIQEAGGHILGEGLLKTDGKK